VARKKTWEPMLLTNGTQPAAFDNERCVHM